MAARGLLLDVGVVIARSAWELADDFERSRGLPAGTVPGRGVFAPHGDANWQRHLAGEITEGDYWFAFAAAAVANGAPLEGQPHFMRTLFHADDLDQMRPQALRLVADAQAAGIRYGILTNELTTLQGEGWVARFPVLASADVFVDAALEGIRKPAREIYDIAIERMRLPADEIVFVDDNPTYVQGGRAAGLRVLRLDPLDPDDAFDRARRELGLG